MQDERLASQFERTLASYVRKLLGISIVIVIGFCVYHTMQGAKMQAIIEAVMVVAYSITWVAVRDARNVKYVLHVIMAVGLLGLLLNMREETNTAMWLGTLIIAAFALFEKKQGMYWVVIVNASVLIYMLIDSLREVPAYPLYFASNVVLSCLWLSLIAFFAYRNTREQHEWTLEEETERERKAMVQTLAGGMAHVMNNEMLAIVGRLECLQFRLNRKEDANELEEIIELAMKVSEHGNRLALYAQPDQEQKQSIDLYDTCRAVVKQLDKSLPQEIDIKLKEADFTIQCFADEVQIAQALVQTIENAKDAIDQRWQEQGRVNHGRIGISFQKICVEQGSDSNLQSGQYVRITIADDGWGVAEDMQDKMFKPFSTSKRAGRGMGLAVVQSIVQRHGGEVSFESDVGKGSLFYICLPIGKCAKV
jgi:signal transduction histidine kinase